MRLFVDLERNGKAERQAGRNTFISAHQLEDVGRIKAVLTSTRLMVRVNPLHEATKSEVDAVLAYGLAKTDLLMLPMFRSATELQAFARIVAGRCGIVALLETAEALATLDDWVGTPGLFEVYVGLNDLHLSLGLRFMFEPLALGWVDRVAQGVQQAGLRFAFGGMARVDEGLLPGREVMAEHLRLNSTAVILSRTFNRPASGPGQVSDTASLFEDEVERLRQVEVALARRSPAEVEADRLRIGERIRAIASQLGQVPVSRKPNVLVA
jgi:hypothetical protein